MEFRNDWKYPFLDLKSQVYHNSSSFSFEVDRAKLNYLDEGSHDFNIVLYDKYTKKQNLKKVSMDINYIDLEWKKIFSLNNSALFPFNEQFKEAQK